MHQRLFLFAAMPVALAAAVPQSFSTHIPDRNPQHSALLLVGDASGNQFVVSSSRETSAIVHIHIVKTNPVGDALASFDFGGSGVDTPTAAAIDPQGNLIIVGTAGSTDFPLMSPMLTTGQAFATKIDAQLQHIIFSTRLGTVGGGPSGGGARAVAVDRTGNIYITGATSDGFPTTSAVLQPKAPALSQAGVIEHGFVTELSAAGDRIVFSTYFSGSDFNCYNDTSPCIYVQGRTGAGPPIISTVPSAIAIDASGAVTIAGITSASNLPVSPGAYASQCNCTNVNSVAFIARLAAGGTKLIWGTYLPLTKPTRLPAGIVTGVPLDTVRSLALNGSGNVVIAGIAASDFPVSPNALQPVFPSASGQTYAGYVAKLDSAGARLLFSTWLGGVKVLNASAGPIGLAIDKSGTLWATGNATAATLPAPASLLGDNYLAGISADGTSVVSLITVPAGAAGQAVQTASNGTVYALGASGNLLVSSAAAGPSILGLSGSFSYTATVAVAPRQLISLYGIGIGPSAAQSASITGGIISNSLGGARVLFDGVPAALLYAGPNQINAIVPSATAGRETTTVSIVTPTGTVAGPTLSLQPTLPQVLGSMDGRAYALNQDGTLNSPSNPAVAGSIEAIWLTGGGAQSYTPDNVISQSLRGNSYPVSILATNPRIPFAEPTSLEVLYAGDAPSQPSGVIQVNFRLPAFAVIYQVQIGTATANFSIW